MTNCDMQNIGNEFSRKPIALAVQQNSDLKDKLSSAILKLLNQRKLENLKEKWWNRNNEKKECPDAKKQSDGISINNIGDYPFLHCFWNTLDILNFNFLGGVFIVIFIGVVLACVTLVIEYWYFKGKEAKVVTLPDQHRNPTSKVTQFNYNKNRSNLNFHLNNQELILRQLQNKRTYGFN